MAEEPDDEEEFFEDLKFAFDTLACTKLDWLAQGRSERSWWKWVRDLLNSRAANIALEDETANDA